MVLDLVLQIKGQLEKERQVAKQLLQEGKRE